MKSDLLIHEGDNLPHLQSLATRSVDLIYIDPPFGTGKTQRRSPEAPLSYQDDLCGEELHSFLEPRLSEAHRVLGETGSLFVHLDYREVHYIKVLLDQIFGRESFKNEIIWAYDYGARSKSKWPAKHDNILWYAKDPERYTFNYEEMDRIPYMA